MKWFSCGLVLLVVAPFSNPVGDVAAADSVDRPDFAALRLAVQDLIETFSSRYPDGPQYLQRLDALERRSRATGHDGGPQDATVQLTVELAALQRAALLANPLLDFDRLLLIQRKPLGDPRREKGEDKGLGKFLGLPQQSSWQQDEIPDVDTWENEIVVVSDLRGSPKRQMLFKPSAPRLVGDLELHYDAQKIAFSMPNQNRSWQICEIDSDGGSLRQLTPDEPRDVHNFDPAYLPDGRIVFASTAPLQGVPCNASVNVAMTYRMDPDGSNIRQLCFDQDHNYCPTIMNDGRIMYLRWEYTDIPHVWGRYLFTMNPDGTGQREFYGSGGYWPNSIFYSRPVPDHPSQVVGIVTGHHVGRVGELVILDPARGRTDVQGVVQRIPGRGERVEPLIEDRLTMDSWPKFLHPYPLSGKHILVSCKPTPDSLWGIYLVDVFDNMVLIDELEGYALLEPIPFHARKKPPVIPDSIDPDSSSAVVYLENVYQGPGLRGVPLGEVKKLRLFTYHFAYQAIAGISHRVGADGPWEPKRVLGTVPVQPDGSAMFQVPANTPISIQPLDADGKALALMRSWTTAMPGEVVSCVGCHEQQNTGPPNKNTIAAKRRVSKIRPWHGPERGFRFAREVQPVVDRYCVGCHDGTEGEHHALPDLRGDQSRFIVLKAGDPQPHEMGGASKEDLLRQWGGVFEPAYFELRRLVRVGGFESDIRVLDPAEFEAETSELIQMLKKGHYGVELDAEAWDRLYTWIDLNAPCHGTWQETVGVEKTQRDHGRRIALRKLYAGIEEEDPEAIVEAAVARVEPVVPAYQPAVAKDVANPAGWPFDPAEAERRQQAAGAATRRTIDLGGGIELSLALVPEGRFVMGDPDGHDDERRMNVVEIQQPFWMGQFEVTNAQYRRFDPGHDSRFEHKGSWVFWEHHLGWPLDGPDQPVVRVSQQEALAFCGWLSERIGEPVSLPTEAQWEYACRAGTAGAFWYGDLEADFSEVANLADATIRQLAYDTDGRHTADMTPRDDRYDDGSLVTADVGAYRANPWGLADMHGNVAEWTRSAYRPYPYVEGDGRNAPEARERVVVRGGSWRDRPKLARSGYRLSYPAWQRVYNVGFRVVIGASVAGQPLAIGDTPIDDQRVEGTPDVRLHAIDAKNPESLRQLFRYTGEPMPVVSAHRGGPRAGFPENCVATFENTLRHTYAMMEIDPRYTKDGEIVVHHDATLDRTTTGTGPLAQRTLQELKELRLKDTAGAVTEFQIPTLDEVLQWARGKTVLVLDQKDVPVEARVRKIEEHRAEAYAMLIVYSYQDARKCYDMNKNIMMEVMVPNREKFREFDRIGVPWSNIIAFVGHSPPDDKELFQMIHAKGACCMVGTSRNLDRELLAQLARDATGIERDYRDLLQSGADLIETDLPIEVGNLLYGESVIPAAKAEFLRRR